MARARRHGGEVADPGPARLVEARLLHRLRDLDARGFGRPQFRGAVGHEHDRVRRRSDRPADRDIGSALGLRAHARIEEPGNAAEIAFLAVAEEQFLRLPRARGIDVEAHPGREPALHRLERVGKDRTDEGARGVAALPDQPLQRFQRRRLDVPHLPTLQRGDGVRGRARVRGSPRQWSSTRPLRRSPGHCPRCGCAHSRTASPARRRRTDRPLDVDQRGVGPQGFGGVTPALSAGRGRRPRTREARRRSSDIGKVSGALEQGAREGERPGLRLGRRSSFSMVRKSAIWA